MKYILSLFIAILPFMASAKWKCLGVPGHPISSTLEVYRPANDVTYRYVYNYSDSTFHIEVHCDATTLALVKNFLDANPVRPAYVEVMFRFKGGPDGKQELSYKITDPAPDPQAMVRRGYFESCVKDSDLKLLHNLQNSKKMEIRYWDIMTRTVRSISLDTKDFCK